MTALNFSTLLHYYADGMTADGCLSLLAAKKVPLLLKNWNQGLGWKSHTVKVCEGEANDSLTLKMLLLRYLWSVNILPIQWRCSANNGRKP